MLIDFQMEDGIYFTFIAILIPFSAVLNPIIFLISDWKTWKKILKSRKDLER